MTAKKLSHSSPIKGAIIVGLIKLLAFLPLSLSRQLTRFFAWLSYITHSKNRKVTERNLEICFPALSIKERERLTQKSLLASNWLVAETARVWLKPPKDVLKMVSHIEGESLIFDLMNDDKGVLLMTPHIGNWELLFTYLNSHFQVSALYRPPKIAELDPIMIAGRERAGGKMIKTGKMQVRKMLQILNKAQSLIILPDQKPPEGSGVMAPFYGKPAYTMTLLHGLAERTDSTLVMSTCIRIDDGFKIVFRQVDIDPKLPNDEYAEKLNLELQQEIDKDPEQYEWAYKRFKGEPDVYG